MAEVFSNYGMKKEVKNEAGLLINEKELPFIRTFSSQEEAAHYKMIQLLQKTDMDKFQLLCRMMRIGKMLSSVNIIK